MMNDCFGCSASGMAKKGMRLLEYPAIDSKQRTRQITSMSS